MAKYEKHLTGNFDEFLQRISDSVLNGSMSASYEDGSDWTSGEARCAVRVFERYSAMGGNRVSMNVTLVGKGEELFLTAITSGGSQAVFWKVNTMGEEAFLQTLIDAMERKGPALIKQDHAQTMSRLRRGKRYVHFILLIKVLDSLWGTMVLFNAIAGYKGAAEQANRFRISPRRGTRDPLFSSAVRCRRKMLCVTRWRSALQRDQYPGGRVF